MPYYQSAVGLGVFESEVVTCAAAAGGTAVMELACEGQVERLAVEVENADALTATDNFAVDLQMHADGEWVEFLADSDFDNGEIMGMLWCTATGPHELAAEGKAQMLLDVGGAHAVRFRAGGNAATADVQIRGRALKH